MAMVRRNYDYHLRVISYCGDPESHRFERRVDDFLEDLYNVGVSGRTPSQPPLAFSACMLSEHDGHQVALVKSNIRIASQIFSTLSFSNIIDQIPAVPKWCTSLHYQRCTFRFLQKDFKPDAASITRTLSLRSILGLSAVSGIFQRMWNGSLSRQILSEREAFLRRIEEGLNDEYLPDWAITSSFAPFTGALFLRSLTGVNFAEDLEQITEAAISNCITIGTSILVNLSEQAELAHPHTQEKRWDILHKEFNKEMEKVICTITELTVSQDNRSDDLLYADLYDHLWSAIAAAAKTHIANRELLLAYLKLQKEAHMSMIANGVRAAASLSSALSFTTTTVVLPLMQWGLMDAAGFLLLGKAPMVQMTTLGLSCTPLGALLVGAAAYFGWSRYQDKKKKELFAKKVDYHRKIKAFVLQAWNIAFLTHKLLRLVCCTASNQAAVEFVNDGARSEWRDVITRVNEARGRTTASVHLDPRYIMIFLREQRREFEEWHEDLRAQSAQIV